MRLKEQSPTPFSPPNSFYSSLISHSNSAYSTPSISAKASTAVTWTVLEKMLAQYDLKYHCSQPLMSSLCKLLTCAGKPKEITQSSFLEWLNYERELSVHETVDFSRTTQANQFAALYTGYWSPS
jgi:hypothetical protein